MSGRIADKLHVARTLVGAGVVAPSRPDRAVRALAGLRRWGPTLAAGYLGAAARYPRRRRSSTSWARSPSESSTSAPTRSPTRSRERGIGEGDGGRDHVPQPPRLRRGERRLLEARRARALPEHRLCRPAGHRGRASARTRGRSSTTRSSRAVVRTAASAARPSSPGTMPRRIRRHPSLEDLIAAAAPPPRPRRRRPRAER